MSIDSNTQVIARQSPAIPHPIRSVTLKDTDALHQTCWSHRSITRCQQFLEHITRSMRSKRGVGIVVEHKTSGEIIAYGQILTLSKCLEISDLIVMPDYRS